MIWTNFPLFAGISAALWLSASLVFVFKIPKKKKHLFANILTLSGIVSLLIFIILLWNNLDRPPMRTLGETRLWYAFFLPVVGIITYNRWRYSWFLAYSNLLSLLFIGINLAHPETYNKELMPALQSAWFVPHVIVYIFSYAVLAASWLVSVKELLETYIGGKYKLTDKLVRLSDRVFNIEKKDNKSLRQKNSLLLADNLVYMGFAFLTLGLLFGGLWAKEAWGHYWTWDPKETWAFLTFLAYLTYMHYRYHHPGKVKTHLWVLSISFVILMLAYQGVNYLPTADNSVHTYSQAE